MVSEDSAHACVDLSFGPVMVQYSTTQLERMVKDISHLTTSGKQRRQREEEGEQEGKGERERDGEKERERESSLYILSRHSPQGLPSSAGPCPIVPPPPSHAPSPQQAIQQSGSQKAFKIQTIMVQGQGVLCRKKHEIGILYSFIQEVGRKPYQRQILPLQLDFSNQKDKVKDRGRLDTGRRQVTQLTQNLAGTIHRQNRHNREIERSE